MPLAVIALRFLQFAGAALLFGGALFFLRNPGLAPAPWRRRLLAIAALILAIAAPLNFLAQTAQVAGSISAVADPDSLWAALSEMDFGKSCAARTLLALLALLAIWRLPANPRLFRIIVVLGAMISASFSWMGHGAATPGVLGLLHLGADILHSLAVAGWIGALAVFCLLLSGRAAPAELAALLRNFSGLGILLVCLIAASGVVNSFFLVGLKGLPLLWSGLYGRILLAKIVLFLAMLGLAARNRFTHTPALETGAAPSLAALKRSVLLETLFGILVLALAAWLGTLAPPSSQNFALWAP